MFSFVKCFSNVLTIFRPNAGKIVVSVMALRITLLRQHFPKVKELMVHNLLINKFNLTNQKFIELEMFVILF